MIPTTNRRRLVEGLPALTVAQAFDDGGLALDELRVTIEGGSRDVVVDAAPRVRFLVSSRGGCSVPLRPVSPRGRRPIVEFGFTPADRALGILTLAGHQLTWDAAVYPQHCGELVDAGDPAPVAHLALAS